MKLDKQALLEWLKKQRKEMESECEIDREGAYLDVIEEIQSGAFDLKEATKRLESDGVGELESAHRMMHERNKRLEKELLDAKAKIAVLERDNDMLESSFAGVEGKLDQALEALEWVYEREGWVRVRDVIRSIRGGGADVGGMCGEGG